MRICSPLVRRVSALCLSLLTAVASTGCSSDPAPQPVADAAVDTMPEPEDVFIGTGSLVLTWTVNGMPAAQGCAAAGGVSVRFPANFVQFMQDTTVPCTQGEYRIPDTAATLAAVTAELLDASNNPIYTFVTETTVRARQTTNAAIRFEPPGRLQIRWTINGMAPSAECGLVNARATQFRVQRASPMARNCTAGTMTLGNVQVGPVGLTGELVFNTGDRRPWVLVKSTAEVNSNELTIVDVDFAAARTMM